jgi:hypothetical protein
MTSIAASAKGYKASKKILKGLSGGVDSFCEKALDNLVAKIQADANSELQNKQHILTGELIAEDKLLGKAEKTRIVGTRLIQGAVLEHGRGIVRPKNGKFLHWIDKTTGEDVFAKESGPVNPDPWLEPAILKNTKRVKDVMIDEVSKTVADNNSD